MIFLAIFLPISVTCSSNESLAATAYAGFDGKQDLKGKARKEDVLKLGIPELLTEIYASRKPVEFQQLDVHDIVIQHVPLGRERTIILEAFKSQGTSKVIEDSVDRLVVRDDRGKAMLDPDARSAVMTFLFDADGRLTKVDAVHLKNQ